jgi:hypothetical protein
LALFFTFTILGLLFYLKINKLFMFRRWLVTKTNYSIFISKFKTFKTTLLKIPSGRLIFTSTAIRS